VDRLESIIESISAEMEGMNTVREATLNRARKLVRECAETIRAIHRQEWETAQQGLAAAKNIMDELVAGTQPYPELYHSGYTQDALQEYVEAHLTYALIRNLPLPNHNHLTVSAATYINGLAEAATELRRYILDILRHGHAEESERLLEMMDSIYSYLITIDFTDAITHGLRRRTDVVRTVLERTRGDLTTSFRQQQLQNALEALEKRIGLASDEL
jgi:translin